MTEYNFRSQLGSCISDFIVQKRASGFPYQSAARILYHFDLLVAEKFPEARTLTKEICTAWLKCKPGEHPNGLQRRITPIRQLGKYMRGTGFDVYIIPGSIPNKQVKYEAHIYTPAELKAFFHSVDQCPPSPFSKTRRYVCVVRCFYRSSEGTFFPNLEGRIFSDSEGRIFRSTEGRIFSELEVSFF